MHQKGNASNLQADFVSQKITGGLLVLRQNLITLSPVFPAGLKSYHLFGDFFCGFFLCKNIYLRKASETKERS